jgi:acetyl/propionyl-CoA carboxylase alpha subunit
MNTRLQVEHPVTELVTGVDLVRAQLLVAAGEPLPWSQEALVQRGHAIEARVYAEDPSQGFIPQAGRLTRYREPQWPGVRVDSGVTEGSDVPVFYDPMIAKVIAAAETRPLAIGRLTAALRAFVIEGVKTNVPFLIRILEREEFRRGTVDTAFLDREGGAIVADIAPSATEYRVSSHPRSEVSRRKSLEFDPWSGGSGVSAPARPATKRRRRSGGSEGGLTAPMPATVIKVNARAGDAVKKGDVIVLLEAMKMELPLRAPADAIVAAVHAREGDLVQGETVLVEFAD